MGLMGCTACGGISYPPLHKWASWCEKYITKRLVKHRQFTDFWLVRPLQGLKKTSTNKMLTSREQKYWGSYLAKKGFHGNKKLSWLFTSYSWTTFTFLPILHDTQKNRFRLIGRSSYYQILRVTKLAKTFCGTDYKKEQVGSVAWELETKTKLTFFFRTLIAHYNPKDFLVDRPVLSIYMFLKEVFEKSIQVRYLRKHRFTQTQSQVEFDVYDFCICSSNHVDIFPPLIYKKCTHTPLKHYSY